MRKNINGSVMVWAIVVILIFSVFAALAVSLSYSMITRSTNEEILRQLSLSSKSATMIVSDAVCNFTNPELTKNIIDSEPDVVVSYDFFDGRPEMYDCDVRAKYENGFMIISSTTSENDLSYTYSAVIKKLGDTSWLIISYDNLGIEAERSVETV